MDRRGELALMLLQAKGQLAEADEARAEALAVVHRIEGGLVELEHPVKETPDEA